VRTQERKRFLTPLCFGFIFSAGETSITAYVSSPYTLKESLLPGKIGFSYGSLDSHNPGSRFGVTSVAITSNVATLGVNLLEGPIPVVGNLVSVQGTQTAISAGAPNFNVTNVALSAVSINNITGVGTISFALTSTNIATTPDAGAAIVPVPVVLETLPSSATAGKQFAVGSANLSSNGQRGITWFTQFAGSPSTVTMLLQGADVDQDSQYSTVDQSTNAAGETRSLANVNYQFYRINAASSGGTSPTVAAGIMVR
jgi:hypothetical protein